MGVRDSEAVLAELNRLESLREPAADPDGDPQFRRFVLRGEAELHTESRRRLDRPPVEVQVCEVGREGVAFITSEPLAQGVCWRACFLQRGYVVAQQCLVILACREVTPGVYLANSQFVAEPGLLSVLGVNPGALEESENRGDILGAIGSQTYVAPGEVA